MSSILIPRSFTMCESRASDTKLESAVAYLLRAIVVSSCETDRSLSARAILPPSRSLSPSRRVEAVEAEETEAEAEEEEERASELQSD